MKAHLIDTHLLVQRSGLFAEVKVKYQGQVSQEMCVLGALVFHKHILFLSMLSKNCTSLPHLKKIVLEQYKSKKYIMLILRLMYYLLFCIECVEKPGCCIEKLFVRMY